MVFLSGPAGRHPAADQRHRLERQVVVDLDAGVLGDHCPLGERAEQAHLAEVLAAAMKPERAVRQAVVDEQCAEIAQVALAAGAEAAVPADRQERADHVIAGLEPADAAARLLDYPRPFVSADDRVANRYVASAQVVVGVAQPGRGEPDEHLAVFGRVEVQLGDLPVLAHIPEHRGPSFHAPSCGIACHHPPARRPGHCVRAQTCHPPSWLRGQPFAALAWSPQICPYLWSGSGISRAYLGIASLFRCAFHGNLRLSTTH